MTRRDVLLCRDVFGIPVSLLDRKRNLVCACSRRNALAINPTRSAIHRSLQDGKCSLDFQHARFAPPQVTESVKTGWMGGSRICGDHIGYTAQASDPCVMWRRKPAISNLSAGN